MTQRTKDNLKVLLPFIGTIFLGGVAWRDIKGDVDEAVPQARFQAESLRTDNTVRILMNNNIETRESLRELMSLLTEVCVELKGRAGCR